MCLQGACVVGHEILRTLDDPGQVAHAELVRVEEGGGERQAGRIGKRMRFTRRRLGNARVETADP